MHRNRTGKLGFKIAILGVALLIALGTMSIGYAMWLDTVTINDLVEMGTWGGVTAIPDETSDCYTSPSGGSITCGTSGNTVEVSSSSAEYDMHYYCNYSIQNNGTVPVKIKTITPYYSNIHVTINPGAGIGTVIEAGTTVYFTADAYLTNAAGEGSPFDVIITFTFTTWNQ